MKIARSVILASLLSAFTAHGQTLTPVANPSVLDSSGKFMGHILGYEPGGYVYLLFKLNVNDHVVLTLHTVPGNALAWWQGPNLYYQSPDCSGQAYGLDAGIGERYATIGPNNVLYLSAPGASQQSINVNSMKFPDSPCQATSGARTVAPVNPTVSLDTLYQGPFRATNVDQQGVSILSPLVLALLAGSLAAAGLIIMRR